MLLYAILLLLLGIVLVMAEAFIPSGGILGVLAAIVLVSSLIFAFKESDGVGFAFLGIVVVCVPTVVILGLKVFPKTPIGRRVILEPFVESPEDRGKAGVSDQDFSQLLGKLGKTATPLRPSGIIEINDQRYSAVAEGELIDKNVDIIVIKVEGNSIVVEPRET
jgi:membrane-bound ClpP family serine protease